MVGRVAAVDTEAGRAPTPETRIDLAVEATLKGNAEPRVSVYQPGGAIGSVTGVVAGVPTFTPGERVLLFLRQSPDGRRHVIGLFQGKFSIERHPVTGEEQAVRRLPGSERVLDAVPLGHALRIVRERS